MLMKYFFENDILAIAINKLIWKITSAKEKANKLSSLFWSDEIIYNPIQFKKIMLKFN